MPRRDPFDGLSVFLAVAARGNFRAASEEIGVTPAAISQAVQSLERRLGHTLFHRTTRKVSLTEAGAMLLPVDGTFGGPPNLHSQTKH